MARWVLVLAVAAGCSSPPDLLHDPGAATHALDAIAAKVGVPRAKLAALKVVISAHTLDVYVPDRDDPTTAGHYTYFQGTASAPTPVLVDGDADISTFPADAMPFDMVPGLAARLGFEVGAPVTQLRLQFNPLDRTIPLLVAASFGEHRPQLELYPDGRRYDPSR
jgi:hypothetical protein